jgi:hypothetical protein
VNVGLSIRTAIDAGGAREAIETGQAALTADRASDGDGLWWIKHGGSGEMKTGAAGCATSGRRRAAQKTTAIAAMAVL